MQYDGTSLMAVFDAIAESGEISRAEIAARTGFSQVTVGKAVDQLDAGGIITQYKQERATVGRKTGICQLNNRYGMLLFDFDENIITVADLALTVRARIPMPEPSLAFAEGFSCFVEADCGELMGIGCVLPDGEASDYAENMAEIFPQPPELTLAAGRAAAYANAARFDIAGTALFLRVKERVSGALMLDGRIFCGAQGKAGDFARLIGDVRQLPEKLGDICALLDPSLIHIACGDAQEPEVRRLVLPESAALLVEPIAACPGPSDGIAMLLRQKWIRERAGVRLH